ncbi:MAG: hypothetical protein HGA45_24625 [Chloroflexales bacterium]|nr:hypothetical protein [Chloroflexales bacterium]
MASGRTWVSATQSLPDYQPMNPDYAAAQLLQLQAALAQAEQAEQVAEQALAQARALRAECSHRYHNAVVGARTQVLAQYGLDSHVVALVGLTRKSDRRRPTRRQAPAQ